MDQTSSNKVAHVFFHHSVEFHVLDGKYEITTGSPELQKWKWVHIAVVMECEANCGIKLYFNSILTEADQTKSASSNTAGTGDVIVGGEHTSFKIDNLVFLNKNIKEEEILYG